jgi:cytoskeletal protein CcmA (bactofilin family)
MALVISDRIKETTTTTGTGTYTLSGAVTGFETFTANLSNSDTTYYCCTDNTDFEVGLGTFTSSGTTLARTTILSSSNSNNAVNWTSGTRTVFCTLPAAKTVFLDASGNTSVSGSVTAGSFVIGSADINENDLESIDGITAGTVSASKAAIVDTNKDITGFRNITLTGELDAGSLDVSGDVDVDGTLETDALSIASTTVTATATEINKLDGVTATTTELNYTDTGASVGTVVASKVVTADANKDVASFRNITLTGELDAGSLDISGDADIDGTLEADAITVNGTALNTVIAGVTVANATLAATATVTDSTANTNFPVVFHDESNGLLDDTGALRYNPSTGELLVPKLTVAGVTTTADTVTMQAANAVVFEGATADAHETTLTIVDPTADRTINLPNVSGTIPVLAAASNTAITATPAELNILDGVTASATDINLIDGITNGTVIASKAIITDSNKDISGGRNITISGELDAATLDISGDADIDGTLEADAITVNGATLSSVIQDESTALAIALG